MPAVGKLTEFTLEEQTCEDYIEQLAFYLDAVDITEGLKTFFVSGS